MSQKLLALCYRDPKFGESQNAQGQYYILQSVSRIYEIRILSFNTLSTSVQDKNYLVKKIKKIFNFILLGISPRITSLWDKKFLQAFRSSLEEFKPDIVYVDHILMMQYLFKSITTAKIILYNEESQLYIKEFNLRRSIIELVKNFRLSKFEKKVISLANKTFVITDQEARYLTNRGFNSVKTMPYAIDEKFFIYGWNPNQRFFNLLFVGDYAHQPNEEAAKYICKKIYPALKNLNIKITLIGRNIHKIKKYLNPEISIFENVDDVRPYYWGSTLFIAPIFSGAGMRIKILEAAMCGIPILMTPLANLGVNLENIKEVFIRNDINEMIDAIKSIYNLNQTNLLDMSKNAHNRIKAKFNIEIMNKLYIDCFLDL